MDKHYYRNLPAGVLRAVTHDKICESFGAQVSAATN
jgi:hypothetical protein